MYPPMGRHRNDSHGSGAEDSDSGRPEGYDRDPRQFFPPMPHPSQYDGRAPPFFDQRMYQEYEKHYMDPERR